MVNEKALPILMPCRVGHTQVEIELEQTNTEHGPQEPVSMSIMMVDKKAYIILVPCRVVRTQVEVEMELEQTDTEHGPREPVITIEEEEEVVLFWDNGTKSKSIRELALGMSDNIKEDREILSYYRYIVTPAAES